MSYQHNPRPIKRYFGPSTKYGEMLIHDQERTHLVQACSHEDIMSYPALAVQL